MKKIILLLTVFCMACMTGCGAVEKTINKVYDDIKGGVDKPIVKSYAGNNNNAFIDEDGNLYVNGSYVGDGTDEQHSMPVKVMENVRSVSMGYLCVSAITYDDELYTWGRGEQDSLVLALQSGMLGQGEGVEKSYVPVKIMDNVDSVSYSTYYAFAITKDGGLYQWGGQHGYVNYSPVLIMENVKYAFHNDVSAAAITTDGSLYTWNTATIGSMEDAGTYMIKILDDVEMVSAGDKIYSAVTKDGSLYTWGDITHSEAVYGRGTDSDDDSLHTLYKIMDNVKFTQITTFNGIAITEDDDLYVWGSNTHGLIGNGTVTWQGVHTPFKVMEDVKYAHISDESNTDCNIVALKKDGSLYAWGDNPKNLFGDIEQEYEDDPEMPKLTKIFMPFPTKLMDNVSSVNMYGTHMYAVTKDKEAYRLPPTRIKNLISTDNKEKVVFKE